MFTIEKAVLSANGEFNEQSLKEAGLSKKGWTYSKNYTGINFLDADGSLFIFARFSKAVKKAVVNKELTPEQLIAHCKISQSMYDKKDGKGEQPYYSLTIPDALRGNAVLGIVEETAKKAKPLAKKVMNIADLSSVLTLD